MNGQQEHLSVFCPYYQQAVELIGSRWTGAVLRALLSDICRFSELKEVIPGLSDRMLSERLKALEAESLVRRIVIPETPVRIEYRLTEKGLALGEVMQAIARWAETWIEQPEVGAVLASPTAASRA